MALMTYRWPACEVCEKPMSANTGVVEVSYGDDPRVHDVDG